MMSRIGKTALLTLLAASVAFVAPQSVQAQNLLETLFGKPKVLRRVHANEFPPPPPAPKASSKNATTSKPVISAPTYNEYRADALVRVDFGKLKAPLVKVAANGEPPAVSSEVTASVATDFAALGDFELKAEKSIASALISHYNADPEPMWSDAAGVNDRARVMIRILGDASSYGLEPADYAVSVPGGNDQAALGRFEMELSARALRYARDANGARIDPNRMSGYYDLPAKPLDLTKILDDLGQTADLAGVMAAQHPAGPEYQALRVELEALRSEPEIAVRIDPKLLLRPGESSPEMPLVVKILAKDLTDEEGGQFGEALFRLKDSPVYDKELVPLVKARQKAAGLGADGIIGPRTVQALAGVSKADRIDKVIVALEQMRWLPRELGATRVFINQPAFTASYIENGEEQLKMRTVVGKTTNQTSFFYDQIKQVDYNPYWGVPQSIIVNEMLPRLRRDPGYLDRSGYQVFNAKGQQVPSSSVDWGSYGAKIPYAVRQEPSEANALGELKILFPNKHAIYMHDTPQKQFFQRDQRALSHGCVRLADPRGMAAAVLGKSRDYVADKLAKGHSTEKVSRKIPVYLAYFTAWPNKDGTVEYFGDVYGRDTRVLDAIEKTDTVRAPTI